MDGVKIAIVPFGKRIGPMFHLSQIPTKDYLLMVLRYQTRGRVSIKNIYITMFVCIYIYIYIHIILYIIYCYFLDSLFELRAIIYSTNHSDCCCNVIVVAVLVDYDDNDEDEDDV